MKNQYFGDIRDLFKYDLCLELLVNTPINKFLFIPMLTPNDERKDGNRINYKKAKAGLLRRNLVEFLQKCIKEEKRDISILENFFKKFNRKRKNLTTINHKIKLCIYKKNEYFTNKNRLEYFQNIPFKFLKETLILVDPDNGLEVKSKSNPEKYLLYSELKILYKKMDDKSILVVFQFIPRIKRFIYFHTISQKIKTNLGSNSKVLFISDNQIVFFIILKHKTLYTNVRSVLSHYAKIYELIFGER